MCAVGLKDWKLNHRLQGGYTVFGILHSFKMFGLVNVEK